MLLFTHCSHPVPEAQSYLQFQNGSTVILLYKVADRSLKPKGPCCSNKRYSILSFINNEIVLHLIFSKASAISSIVYKAGDRQVNLPDPELIFKMPNSPVRTCVTLQPDHLGVLTALDPSGNTCVTIDLNSKSEEIRNLAHAIDTTSGMIFYGKIPTDLYSKPENNTSSP
jgi:hypothetical protein